MKLKKHALTRAILATGLVAGLGLSQTAMAEAAEGDLVITAGLQEAMTVVCTQPLSFGITRVATGERGGSTTVTVNPNNPNTGAGTLGGQTDDVTPGTTQRGVCEVSGSQADDNTLITVSFNPDTTNLGGQDGAEGLDEPETALGNLAVASFTTSRAKGDLELQDGATTFGVGGTLTIPNDLITDNLGGYGATIEVVVNDVPA